MIMPKNDTAEEEKAYNSGIHSHPHRHIIAQIANVISGSVKILTLFCSRLLYSTYAHVCSSNKDPEFAGKVTIRKCWYIHLILNTHTHMLILMVFSYHTYGNHFVFL